MSNIGSRCKVMHGNANKTSGGLTKDDLMYNKQGKIVSIKMSNNAIPAPGLVHVEAAHVELVH